MVHKTQTMGIQSKKNAPSFIIQYQAITDVQPALQTNNISMPVNMNRKIKKPPVKLSFWQCHNNTTNKTSHSLCKTTTFSM